MKVISTNRITSVVASSEDSDFPDGYLLDTFPGRKWKAASSSVNSVTLTYTFSGAADALALFNIDAEDYDVTTSVGGATIDYKVFGGGLSDDTRHNLWAEFSGIGSGDTVVVTLTKSAGSSTTISAGITRAGAITELRQPNFGITESLVDYSVYKEFTNGTYYTSKRDVARKFDFVLDSINGTDFYTLMDFKREQGYSGAAWRLTDLDSIRWVLFGRFDDGPSGAHNFVDFSSVNVSLIEAV